MRDRNVFRQDGKMYVKKIKDCICVKNCGDIYTLECRIKEKGINNYEYAYDDGFIRAGSMGEKKLWLCEDALCNVRLTVDEFEKQLNDARNGLYTMAYVELYDIYVYYMRIEKERYNFIIDFGGENRTKGEDIIFLRNKKVPDLMKEIRSGIFWNCFDNDIVLKAPECCGEDLFYIKVAGKDDILERLIRLYYREESAEDCKCLEKVFLAPVLPRLPKKYNRCYYVKTDTIPGYDMLERSGYKIMHMPNGLMHDHSRKAVVLNPCTKEGVDSAPAYAEMITYNEYLELFGDWFKKRC